MIPGVDQVLDRIEAIRARFEPPEFSSPIPEIGGDFATALASEMGVAANPSSGARSPWGVPTPVLLPTPVSPLSGFNARSDNVDALIAFYANKHGVEADLVKALVKAESGFNPRALSPKGAMGLTQLMPDTAKALGIADPLDASQNLDGGVRYLKQQIETFGDVSLALAAYNAGPAAVRRYGGVPPYAETRGYVERVLRYRDQFKAGAPSAQEAP